MSETPDPNIAKIAAEIAAQVAAQAIAAAKAVAVQNLPTPSPTMGNPDHDLLIAVHEQVKQLRVEVKGLSDNMDGRLSRVENTKLAATDFVSFRNEQVITDDKLDTRVKLLETFKSVLMGAFIISNIVIVPVIIWLVISALSKS